MERKIRDPKRAKLMARRRRVTRSMSRSGRPRLTVFRSARHIYAQLVDPESGRTVGSVSTRARSVSEGLSSTSSIEAAQRVGKAIAELAKARNIDEVVFNRNGFLYHGRIKALAEAAREAGLRF